MKRKTILCFITITLAFLVLNAYALYSLNTFIGDKLLYTAYANRKPAAYPLFHDADAKTMKEVEAAFAQDGYGAIGRRYLSLHLFQEPAFLMLLLLWPSYGILCFGLFQHLHKQQRAQIQAIVQAVQQTVPAKIDARYQPIIDAHIQSLKRKEREAASLEKESQNQREHYENLAHQVKAILTTTMLHADMLLEEDKPQPHLSAILAQMEKANHLLDMSLQGKQIKSNLLPYHFTYAPLSIALDKAIQRTQPYAQTKNIQFSLSVDQRITLAYDSFWMEEAIETILRNGITYANASSFIKVSLSIHKETILLDIHDSGTCMSQKDIQQAFVRYAHSNHKEHYGIGLAMAKQIIEQHFGTITILPTAHGVTFRLMFAQMKPETIG